MNSIMNRIMKLETLLSVNGTGWFPILILSNVKMGNGLDDLSIPQQIEAQAGRDLVEITVPDDNMPDDAEIDRLIAKAKERTIS